MRGCFIFTGKENNNGEKNLILDNLLSEKINNLVIHSIPLSTSPVVTGIRFIGGVLQLLVHPKLSPTLSHIAIQLNLENDDIVIIEYGQYITKDSDIKNGFFSSGSKSSNTPRKDSNDNLYYYINKDGARITLFKYKTLQEYEKKDISISDLIAIQYYEDISLDQYRYKKYEFLGNNFHKVDCDINNKITVNELIDNFKGEKWEAEKYNLLFHNCQTFAAKIIEILKAIRKKIRDKIRAVEKITLPGCIINALWHNEKLSLTNTLGRIPIFGFFYDIYVSYKEENGRWHEY